MTRKANLARAMPVYGAIAMREYWWPKTTHEKNILIGKVMVFIYVCLAFIMTTFTSYMLILTIILILWHIEWIYDKNDLPGM